MKGLLLGMLVVSALLGGANAKRPGLSDAQAAAMPVGAEPLDCQDVTIEATRDASVWVAKSYGSQRWRCLHVTPLSALSVSFMFDTTKVKLVGTVNNVISIDSLPFTKVDYEKDGGKVLCTSKGVWGKVWSLQWWLGAQQASERCWFDLNPYREVWILVDASTTTNLDVASILSLDEVWAFLTGLVLYFAAPLLAGAAVVQMIIGFAAGVSAVFIVLFHFAYKQLPGRKVVAFASVIYPATATYLVTVFVPLARTLIGERWFQIYCGVGGCAGIIWMHLYPINNERTFLAIQRACQIAGLTCLYWAPSHPIAKIAFPALVVLASFIRNARIIPGGQTVYEYMLTLMTSTPNLDDSVDNANASMTTPVSTRSWYSPGSGLGSATSGVTPGLSSPYKLDGTINLLTPVQHKALVKATTEREMAKLKSHLQSNDISDVVFQLSSAGRQAVQSFIALDGDDDDELSMTSGDDESSESSEPPRQRALRTTRRRQLRY